MRAADPETFLFAVHGALDFVCLMVLKQMSFQVLSL